MSRGIIYRLRCIAPLFALLHLVLAVGKSSATADEDASIIDRLMKEAPRKWAEYESIAKQFQGTVTRYKARDEKRIADLVLECKHNNDCESLGAYDPAGESLESVIAFNPKYSFEVRRKTKTSPWVLTQLKLHRGEDKPVMYQEYEDGARARCVLVAPCSYSLSELFQQPTFQVRDARWVKRNDGELVEMSFLNTHDITAKPFNPIQSGTLVLDPNRYWCVRSGELVLQYSNASVRVKLEIALRDSQAGYPLPISCVETRSRMDTTSRAVQEDKQWWQYDFQVPTRLPDTAEFTLSAFGLPEPPGVTWPKPTPWYLWVIGMGLALALVGVVVRLVRRRYASRLSTA